MIPHINIIYTPYFLHTGNFNDAKRQVEKSLELDKTYVKAWAKKGDIEFFMKEWVAYGWSVACYACHNYETYTYDVYTLMCIYTL